MKWIDTYDDDGSREAFDADQLTRYRYRNGPAVCGADRPSQLTLYFTNGNRLTLVGDRADELEARLFHHFNPQLVEEQKEG
jgi:hypothetical protein